MDELVLNNRRIKLVDGEVYVWMDYKHNPCWRKIKMTLNNDGYYYFQLSNNKKQKGYFYHRVVYKFYNRDWDMTYTPDNQIDHIDNDKNNTNIENLRVVNNSENKQNSSNVKGYTWSKHKCKYQAQIRINHKAFSLGVYDTAEEAHEAYLVAKIKYHTH